MTNKDWTMKAARAILRNVGENDVSAESRIAAIIAKHCPFEPGAAYIKVASPEPGHVWDWAARASVYLQAEGVGLSVHRIAAVVAHFAKPLVKLLEEARREHDARCPAFDDEEVDDTGPCRCGAAKWNMRIDEVLYG